MQSRFWFITKITIANLCKPIHDFIIIPVSSDPLSLETMESYGKMVQKIKNIENGKSFLDGIKTIFIILEMLFFGKIQKDRGYKL